MTRLIGVFGSSGFGREVASLMLSQLDGEYGDDKIVFVETSAGSPVNGMEVMSQDEFVASELDRLFTIAIADCKLRKKLFETAAKSGAKPMGIRSRSSEVHEPASIGAGEILCGHSTITCNTQVGRGFHLNVSSYLAHDCKVGEFVTFGPNVVCSGNVIIEDEVYVGGGALIRQGTPDQPMIIGAGSVLGMGAVVTKSVASGSVMIGNPAIAMHRT